MATYHNPRDGRWAFVIMLAILGSIWFFGDEIERWFFGPLQIEAASCGDFQDALPAEQATFLQDCDCLEDDSDAVPKALLDVVEKCVRAKTAVCSKDESLHEIYRGCAAAANAPK